jgi:hypothetical protein
VDSGTIQIEPVRWSSGEAGRDFVIYDEFGGERFSARLMDGSTELAVTWTDNVPWLVLRLREVQIRPGGSGGFTRIRGVASDQLELAILAGTFDAERAVRLLSRGLGGNWQVGAVPRPQTASPILEVLAERVGDKP